MDLSQEPTRLALRLKLISMRQHGPRTMLKLPLISSNSSSSNNNTRASNPWPSISRLKSQEPVRDKVRHKKSEIKSRQPGRLIMLPKLKLRQQLRRINNLKGMHSSLTVIANSNQRRQRLTQRTPTLNLKLPQDRITNRINQAINHPTPLNRFLLMSKEAFPIRTLLPGPPCPVARALILKTRRLNSSSALAHNNKVEQLSHLRHFLRPVET